MILHEMLLGRAPSDLAPSRTKSGPIPDVPPDILEVLRRALAQDPKARYDSAGELAIALSEARTEVLSARDSFEGPLSLRRRPTAAGLPTVWCLSGDPALRRPAVLEALDSLRGSMRVEEVSADQRAELCTAIAEGDAQPPWIVLFGGMHVILEDPLLTCLASHPEVSRLMISTHANAEILETAINFCGMDQHVTLPSSPDRVREALRRMAERTGVARRYCDDLRAGAPRTTPVFPPEPSQTPLPRTARAHVAKPS